MEESIVKIKIPKTQIEENDRKTIKIFLPNSSKLHNYFMYVPNDKTIKEEDGYSIQFFENKNYRLTNNTKKIYLSGNEILEIFNGKDTQKEAIDKVLYENLEELPNELKEKNNWVVYYVKWNKEKGKNIKILINAKTGKWAESNNPDTWSDFNSALKYAKEHNADGVAFALNRCGITCIDIDNSINDKGGLSLLAEECLKRFKDTYVETSVSGRGLHIFIKEDILQGDRYKNRSIVNGEELEVYDNVRIISMTGNNKFNRITSIIPISAKDKEWLQKNLGEKVKPKEHIAPTRLDKNDSVLIDIIRKSKKASEFNALYSGVSLTGDHSRDDFKLLNLLAFFSECNASQMDSVFRSSGLYRPEKGDKYLERSIEKAIATLRTRIRPFGVNKNTNSSKRKKMEEKGDGRC